MNKNVYLVGGAVRDLLLGKKSSDLDYVVINSSEEEMLSNGFKPVGADFPVFLHPDTGNEYALARTERKTGKGYNGFSVSTNGVTLKDDLFRRDITINAMAIDSNGNLIDPFNGLSDLSNGVIRHVSEAFREDPVRILRVARFCATYDFILHEQTLHLMKEMVTNGEVDNLTSERVWAEIKKTFSKTNPSIFFRVLDKCGALNRLVPHLSLNETVNNALDKAVNDKKESCDVVFSILMSNSRNEGDIHDICEKLKIPTNEKRLAILTYKNLPKIQHALNNDYEELFKIIESLDVHHKTDTLDKFIRICEIVFNDFDTEKFMGLIDRVRSVSSQHLLEQGLTGAAFGIELKRLRKEALNNIIKE
jgi:tRNA nucleotidyltransferase (CCA-adding enzyme)